jgi:hypothetical protein
MIVIDWTYKEYNSSHFAPESQLLNYLNEGDQKN